MPQPHFNGCRQPDQCLADGTAAHRAPGTNTKMASILTSVKHEENQQHLLASYSVIPPLKSHTPRTAAQPDQCTTGTDRVRQGGHETSHPGTVRQLP